MKLFARKNIFSIFLLLLGYTTFAQENTLLVDKPATDSTKTGNALVCYNGCETAKNDYFSIICSKKKIIQFIVSKLELPPTIEEGQVRLQLDFDLQGKLIDLKILEAINEASGQAVLVAAQTLPDLLPGMQAEGVDNFTYKVYVKITSDSTYYNELLQLPIPFNPYKDNRDYPIEFVECFDFPDVKWKRKLVVKLVQIKKC